MANDFDLIIKHIPQNNDLHIYPIADVHLGAVECMEGEWQRFCKEILLDPNAYLILAGDLLNNTTRGSVGNVFEDRMRPKEAKRMMAEILAPLRDRILCCTTGNHERRNRDCDDDPTYDILAKLDLEDIYRENMAFLKIQVGKVDGDGKKNPTYLLQVSHGSGGGMLTGSAVNKYERFAYLTNADILIAAHVHKTFNTVQSRIYINPYNNKVSVLPFRVICCTPWLEYGGYALQKMLLPSAHALQKITLSGNHKEIKVEM